MRLCPDCLRSAAKAQGPSELLNVEEFLRPAKESLRVEVLQFADHAMRGKYRQCRTPHVEKRHRKPLVSRVRRVVSHPSHLVTIGKRGLITMVSVRDDQLHIFHRRNNLLGYSGVREKPKRVGNSIFIDNIDVRSGLRTMIENSIDSQL
jgi:hypothetical protein